MLTSTDRAIRRVTPPIVASGPNVVPTLLTRIAMSLLRTIDKDPRHRWRTTAVSSATQCAVRRGRGASPSTFRGATCVPAPCPAPHPRPKCSEPRRGDVGTADKQNTEPPRGRRRREPYPPRWPRDNRPARRRLASPSLVPLPQVGQAAETGCCSQKEVARPRDRAGGHRVQLELHVNVCHSVTGVGKWETGGFAHHRYKVHKNAVTGGARAHFGILVSLFRP